jgi:hypothetical protein
MEDDRQKMEDELKKMEDDRKKNGRQPKTIYLKIKNDLTFLFLEDDLNFFNDGIRPHFYLNGR